MRFFRGLVPQADAPYGRALGFPCCLYRKFMLFSPTILPLYPLLTAENPVFSDYLQMAWRIVAVFASFLLEAIVFFQADIFYSLPFFFSFLRDIFPFPIRYFLLQSL